MDKNWGSQSPAKVGRGSAHTECEFDGKRICFVVNTDVFFLSHRIPIAKEALERGAEVFVLAAATGRQERIRELGFKFRDVPITRSGTNPLTEARSIAVLWKLYRRLSPDLIHHVALKAVIYGSLAARAAGARIIVNHVTGLGYVFTDQNRSSLVRFVVNRLLQFASTPHDVTFIFQNPDDQAYFEKRWLSSEQTVLIRGSGVDCGRFRPAPEPQRPPYIVMLPGRMLWDKGVGEFLEAARMVKDSGQTDVRFVLVGAADDGNPTAVPAAMLRGWEDEGVVEWWGFKKNMETVLEQAHIIVLPSYREGLGMVLVEAAATARPIVTTDVPGCREVVRHGENGLLIPPRSAEALASAIATLLEDVNLRRRMGKRGREMATQVFAEETVVDATMRLYRWRMGRSGTEEPHWG